MGAKKQPSYRIVVVDSRAPRQGAYIEAIGFYDPMTDPATVRVDSDKARHWLQRGAQPTDTVERLLKRAGVIAQPEGESAPARPPITAETGESAAAPAE